MFSLTWLWEYYQPLPVPRLCTEAFKACTLQTFSERYCGHLNFKDFKTRKYNMTSFKVFFWLSRMECSLTAVRATVCLLTPRGYWIFVKQQTVGGLEIELLFTDQLLSIAVAACDCLATPLCSHSSLIQPQKLINQSPCFLSLTSHCTSST